MLRLGVSVCRLVSTLPAPSRSVLITATAIGSLLMCLLWEMGSPIESTLIVPRIASPLLRRRGFGRALQ